MHYRRLGNSGLTVSALCLGAMMFGDRTDADAAREIVASARDAGVNFIDTADVYAKGESERIVGALIRDQRAQWVLATKVGYGPGTGPHDRGLGRVAMARALDASLARLGTDHVDIYYFHRDDAATPLAESLAAVGDFIRQGKVRHFALSNFRGWRIAEVVRLCDLLGVPRPVCLQPHYNAMNRIAEVEMLPACHHYGLGVVPYSPLARGVLTGKYLPGATPPEGSRVARADRRILQTEFRPESLDLVQRLQAHAVTRGTTASHFALAWVLANEHVSSVIAGPRTLAQWQDYLGALEVAWSAEDEAFVDSLVPPGHASSHGFTDPSYPVRGRRLADSAVRGR